MDVVAFTARERLTAESRKDDSYCVPGTGDPDGLIPSRWFHGYTQQDLNNFLDQDLDLLVICIPLTASSRNMISKQQFEILAKKKTFVSNVGRGGLINTDDLIEALEQGMIRGAAVDVTNPEPLPQDHPLWKAPNLLITPHVSWVTINHLPRTLAIFETNVTALRTGTEFVNLVNKERHY
jgi:phosphoglycerate dehydrogenase-like enzyme